MITLEIMKKQKSKKVKTLKGIQSISKLRLFSALAVVVFVAGIGVYTLLSSFADSTTGIISVKVVDKATGKPLVGEAYVSISVTTPNTLCTNMDGVSDSDGQINFSGCRIGIPYTITFITFKGGWYQVAPSSSYTYNSQLSIQPGTQQTIVFISTVPTDSDGDGVPNKTDSCVSSAGPASNNGCPMPAAPAAPSTPTTPVSTPSTSTSSKPSTSSSGSSTSKKTTTTSTPAATAPATVVATSGDTSPPSAPENLIISKIDGSVFISWDDASDNVGITGYNIERSTDGQKWESLAKNVTSTSYNDNTVGSANHYYYRVQSVDKSGNLSEGTLGDIQLTASKSSSGGSKTATATAKKSNAGLVAGLTVGIVLIIALIIVTFLVLRRRMLGSNEPYSYDVSAMTPPNMPAARVMPSNTPLPPQTLNIANQPAYNAGPPAQHTSVSLKEMVLEEMNRQGPGHQGQPPMPPQPPNPPVQPQ